MLINNIEVGKRINSIRLSLGESMEKFGSRFNTSKGTVNNWEKGRNLPNKKNLLKIAILGNISLDELLYGNIILFLKSECINFFDDNEKYLSEYVTEFSLYKIADYIIDNNLKYSDVYLLSDFIEEIKNSARDEFEIKIKSKVNEILENKKVLEQLFETQNLINVNKDFNSFESFIDFLVSSDNEALSKKEYEIEMTNHYIRLELNSHFNIQQQDYYILTEDDFVETLDFSRAKKSIDKVSILNISTSLKGYDRIFGFYVPINETLYIAGVYNGTPPLIQDRMYIWGTGAEFETGRYLKDIGFDRPYFGLKMDPKDTLFYAPILSIMY